MCKDNKTNFDRYTKPNSYMFDTFQSLIISDEGMMIFPSTQPNEFQSKHQQPYTTK